jgi:hypothetical protein
VNLNDWEVTIQQMVDEANHEPKEPGRIKVFKSWRVKLEKEPTSLLPFQIDQIVREVRKTLIVANR